VKKATNPGESLCFAKEHQSSVALLQKEPPRDDDASSANECYDRKILLGNSPKKIGLFLAKRSDD